MTGNPEVKVKKLTGSQEISPRSPGEFTYGHTSKMYIMGCQPTREERSAFWPEVS